MDQKTLVVIPTRLAAARLHNKPLAMIHGKPMIIHVWERAVQANVGPVIVACGDKEIFDVVESYGGTGILTSPDIPSGTDRVKAATDIYDPKRAYSIIINVQGDLATFDPYLLQETLAVFREPDVDIATLANTIDDPIELQDPNVVKIVLSLDEEGPFGRALYFSRYPIPSGSGPHYHHIGIYGYRRESLHRFVSLPIHSLETLERLEQLRAISDGMRIDVKVVNTTAPFGVDTPADLEKAIRVISEEI